MSFRRKATGKFINYAAFIFCVEHSDTIVSKTSLLCSLKSQFAYRIWKMRGDIYNIV